MKSKLLLICNLLIILFSLSYSKEREITELNTQWKFSKGHNELAYKVDFDDSAWQNVHIPHDWAIAGPFIKNGDGSTGKLPWKGEGWYRKNIFIPKSYSGKRLYLLCDGIMAFPKIYINGELAGGWDYGYNSFYIEITKFVKLNEKNVLAIHADTRQHDSRWYPGAGIYRKIQLLALNPVHIDIWGTYVTTPVIKADYADVKVATTIRNDLQSDAEISVKYAIMFDDKLVVDEKEITWKIAAYNSNILETTLNLPYPQKWDIDNPNLYTLVTKIYKKEKMLDIHSTTFGVRQMHFTANDGFWLNGRRVQFKGVNLHHDLGPLGAAFNVRAMERELEIMKNMGCNALRTSHNVPAPEVLDLCDRMGILVLDEAFDKYDAKADITDTTKFEKFAQRNIKNFIIRDRNHPSVFLWSVGNEISDVQWNKNNGFEKLQIMINSVKKYDNTRPTTLVCDSYESAKLRHFDYYDIHSWNYGRRYRLARQLAPEKSVIISESASTVSSRGFYEFPLPQNKTDFTSSLQVSSYDLNAPDWAEIADDDFMWQQQEPYIAGEFVWTGFDYLGEPTPYNNQWIKDHGMTDNEASRSSYFGIVDLCGIPKDRYYLYKSYWKPEETTIHILPHWNWENKTGEKIPVFVYTNGDSAELFLNGKSLGKKSKNAESANSVERFRLMWEDVIYHPGELKAVAYKAGVILGEATIKTTGDPFKLRLSPDRNVLKDSGSDLSFILIEAIDEDGNACPLADKEVNINIKGPAIIAGIGNGNPQSMRSFQSNTVNLFYGKAMVILKSEPIKGKVEIEAFAKNLEGARASIKVE